MAGNSESPQPPEPEHAKPGGAAAKTFKCPKCGGAISVKFPGQSLSAACEFCGSVVDITDENYRIISRYVGNTTLHKPRIELGTRGKLKDQTWEVIGFMVRTDIPSMFFWYEYLLFNPYHGFRWLTEADGQWNFVTPIKEKPPISGSAYATGFGGEVATYDSKAFKLFYRGTAQVTYVLGEFYWKVVISSNCQMSDYICPPQMLSVEKDDKEVNWSLSDYITAAEIKEAFKLQGPMDYTYRIGPNQPSKATALWNSLKAPWFLVIAALILIQCFHICTSPSKMVYSGGFAFNPNEKQTDLTTPVFTVDGYISNLDISFHADVDNSWFWVAAELVNNKDGTVYGLERTCEYYHGYDSDGAWTEGSTIAHLTISRVPAGDYYLNVDSESGDFKDSAPKAYSITVTRSVPVWGNFWWAFFLASAFPAIAWAMYRSDEVNRWQQSDFNPYQTSS